MVEHIIEQTAQKVKENQNLKNTDYLDAEGLCWCGICGERKENRYKVLGHDRIKVVGTTLQNNAVSYPPYRKAKADTGLQHGGEAGSCLKMLWHD